MGGQGSPPSGSGHLLPITNAEEPNSPFDLLKKIADRFNMIERKQENNGNVL
jgi:hypothetical protein